MKKYGRVFDVIQRFWILKIIFSKVVETPIEYNNG